MAEFGNSKLYFANGWIKTIISILSAGVLISGSYFTLKAKTSAMGESIKELHSCKLDRQVFSAHERDIQRQLDVLVVSINRLHDKIDTLTLHMKQYSGFLHRDSSQREETIAKENCSYAEHCGDNIYSSSANIEGAGLVPCGYSVNLPKVARHWGSEAP